MSRDLLVDQFEATNKGKERPEFNIGDTVKVSIKIIEGQKERIQVFTGIVIAKKGVGTSKTFTVYRNAYGSSMERVFLLNSPRVTDIEIIRYGDVCKAKLYHIRGKTGKKAKVKEKIGALAKSKKVAPIANETTVEEEQPIIEEKIEQEEILEKKEEAIEVTEKEEIEKKEDN